MEAIAGIVFPRIEAYRPACCEVISLNARAKFLGGIGGRKAEGGYCQRG
jgi:hypothetical protein